MLVAITTRKTLRATLVQAAAVAPLHDGPSLVVYSYPTLVDAFENAGAVASILAVDLDSVTLTPECIAALEAWYTLTPGLVVLVIPSATKAIEHLPVFLRLGRAGADNLVAFDNIFKQDYWVGVICESPLANILDTMRHDLQEAVPTHVLKSTTHGLLQRIWSLAPRSSSVKEVIHAIGCFPDSPKTRARKFSEFLKENGHPPCEEILWAFRLLLWVKLRNLEWSPRQIAAVMHQDARDLRNALKTRTGGYVIEELAAVRYETLLPLIASYVTTRYPDKPPQLKEILPLVIERGRTHGVRIPEGTVPMAPALRAVVQT